MKRASGLTFHNALSEKELLHNSVASMNLHGAGNRRSHVGNGGESKNARRDGFLTALNSSVHGGADLSSTHSSTNHSVTSARTLLTSSSHLRNAGGGRKPDILGQSLHRATLVPEPLRAIKSGTPAQNESLRAIRSKGPMVSPRRHSSKKLLGDDSSTGSLDASVVLRHTSAVHYFEKLCEACEALDYPYEYADIVGSQFLGFECATAITHIDGHVPTMDELVEFLSLVLIWIAHHSDLLTIFLDDFQWVDAFSWKVFRAVCKKSNSTLLICSTRSHDKQALRRMSTVFSHDEANQASSVEITLNPLDFSDIRELVSLVLGHTMSMISD